MLKQDLVVEQKWVSPAEFNKARQPWRSIYARHSPSDAHNAPADTQVFALYQALPGPEATELACYFGMLAKGRFAGLLAGIGFCLPGFCIIMFFAWLYTIFDLFNPDKLQGRGFLASFNAVRPCVPAMAVRAVMKISDHALLDRHEKGAAAKEIAPILLAIAAAGFLLTTFQTLYFVSLAFFGIVFTIYRVAPRRIYAWLFLVLGIVGNIIYLAVQFSQSGYKYLPSASVLVAGTKTSKSLSKNGAIFTTGLLAGVTTFGGAFTAVPYVLRSFVQINGFMRVEQFLDGIAIVNFVPTPLVMFVTWDGFIANGVVGGILMTLGMFLPCFTFVLVLHNAFMFLCKNERFNSFLEGVSAGVIGFIAESACQLARAAIHSGMDTLIFACTMMVLTTSTNKYAPLGIICAAALAGQVLYANGANSLNKNNAYVLQAHESADIAALNATIYDLRAALALQNSGR